MLKPNEKDQKKLKVGNLITIKEITKDQVQKDKLYITKGSLQKMKNYRQRKDKEKLNSSRN